MITAQDIREKTFEKATFGGYAMNEVDDFLDELAGDLGVMQKESSELRGKMKVLADKIKEYRASEEAMHMALVSAQKISKDIEDESQQRADAILADAQQRADEILTSAQQQADELLANAQAESDRVTGSIVTLREAEERRYQTAQAAAQEYIQKLLLLTDREREYLTALQGADLSGSTIVTPAPEEKKALAEPAVEEPAVEEGEYDEPAFEEAPAEPVFEEAPAMEEPMFAEEPVEEAPAEPVRRGRSSRSRRPDYFKEFEEAVYRTERPAEEDGDEPAFRF